MGSLYTKTGRILSSQARPNIRVGPYLTGELGGIQDDEVPGGTGNPAYTEALAVLDEDCLSAPDWHEFMGLVHRCQTGGTPANIAGIHALKNEAKAAKRGGWGMVQP